MQTKSTSMCNICMCVCVCVRCACVCVYRHVHVCKLCLRGEVIFCAGSRGRDQQGVEQWGLVCQAS